MSADRGAAGGSVAEGGAEAAICGDAAGPPAVGWITVARVALGTLCTRVDAVAAPDSRMMGAGGAAGLAAAAGTCGAGKGAAKITEAGIVLRVDALPPAAGCATVATEVAAQSLPFRLA